MSEVIDRPNYCVIRVVDSITLYRGNSLARAAYWLKPGTVYGKGRTVKIAVEEAERLVEHERERIEEGKK